MYNEERKGQAVLQASAAVWERKSNKMTTTEFESGKKKKKKNKKSEMGSK